MADIQQLEESIVSLSLLEASALVKKLEERLGVSAAAAVAAAPAAPAAAVEEVEAAHVEESAAGEQPSGAAQPENSTASQGGEAAGTDPVEG